MPGMTPKAIRENTLSTYYTKMSTKFTLEKANKKTPQHLNNRRIYSKWNYACSHNHKLCCYFKPQLNTLSDMGKIHVSSVKHTYIYIYVYIPTPTILVFPCGSAGKESACHAGDLGSIPGLGRCPGEGKGCPLQYSGLENSMDCIVHGVTKSWTWLSDFHFTLHLPHFSTHGHETSGPISPHTEILLTSPNDIHVAKSHVNV